MAFQREREKGQIMLRPIITPFLGVHAAKIWGALAVANAAYFGLSNVFGWPALPGALEQVLALVGLGAAGMSAASLPVQADPYKVVPGVAGPAGYTVSKDGTRWVPVGSADALAE